MKQKILVVLSLFLSFISLAFLARAEPDDSIEEISDCSNLDQEGVYVLTNDIIDTSISPCINISANNVVLDCQGHIIDSGYLGDYGIYVYRSTPTNTNITIKNCVLIEWVSYGLYLRGSNYNTLINITSNFNNYGLYLWGSNNTLTNITVNFGWFHGLYIYGSNNTLTNIIANSNGYGLYIYGSNNTLTNITASNNYYGLYLWGLSNTLTNITASNNDYGLHIYASNYNTLTNITANSNNNYGLELYDSNYNTLTNIIANSNGYGLYIYGSNNTLTNITASNNNYGLYLYVSNYNTLTNITANSNNNYGLYIDGSSNTLTNITANSNNYGLYLYGVSNTLTNITASNNSYGLYLYYSNYNTIKNSKIQNSINYGIYLDNAANNLIYNNLFNNTNNFYFAGTIYTNYWNTTRQPGDRIYSPGTEIGGNYWTNPSGNGYSDTCTDADKDGFCDSPYTLNSQNIDYLPLSDEYLALLYISDCSNLDQEGVYVLTNDIIDTSISPCINISANNVVLDCQGHIIDSDYSGDYGIYVYRSTPTNTNITIKNCVLTEWSSYGLYLRGSNNNTLTNITSNFNNNGLYIDVSNYNTLINITSNSYGYGLYLWGSNYNTLTNIIANFGCCGLELYVSNNNTLTNITASNNYYEGLALVGSNNTLTNIIANSNGYYGLYIYGLNNTLTNIIANSNYYGLYLHVLDYNTLTNIIANSNYYGLYIGSSFDNTLTNITASNNNYGLYLYYSNYNTIKDSKIQNSINYGIYLLEAKYNLIYNNLFNNTNNFYFEGTIYLNYWNTTRQPGNRIYSPGTEIGGNYWTNPSGNGYSDTCTDADRDGFCDSPYTLNSQNIDYLPLSDEYSVAYITVTFNYAQVNFGTLNHNTLNPAPNQGYGIYNCTVDTNAPYKVYAMGYDFSGPATLSISNLYFDTNETAAGLSYSNAVSLSTSYQLIDTNIPPTYTTNFHGYWLYIPYGQRAGNYNTTVIIAYMNV